MRNVGRFFGIASCLILGIAFFFSPQTSYGATKAKTPPPPTTMHIESTYSGYTYLAASSRGIKDNLNQTITITAITTAKTTVAEIGATIQLQEWSGTVWVDVGPATTLYSTNTSTTTKVSTKTTRSGYYYRGRVYHYVKNNEITEGVTEYTDNMLAA